MEPSPPSVHSSRFIDRSRLIACRECRRSKIRCSRIFPCDACVRRGCTDICPDGIKQTKRSKSDETLLQENARLVRRIQYLEGILLSLKHPAALTEDQCGDPASPGQDSHSSEMLPSSDLSDPMTMHHRNASDLVSLLSEPAQTATGTHHYSRPLRRESHDPMKALASQLTQNHASLAPGFQFALRTLLELCRTCGVIDMRAFGSTSLDATVSESHGTIFSDSSPSSTSPPSSCGPLSDTSALASEPSVSHEHPGLKSSAEHVVWNVSDMTTPGLPSSTDGHTAELTTLHVPDQFRESPFQPGQEDAEQCNGSMSSELSQQLLLDLDIMQETHWRS